MARVKLVWFVPEEALDATRDAVFEAGGRADRRLRALLLVRGWNRDVPRTGRAASPALGERGREEHVAELRVETVVPAERLETVVAALERAHPYEEPAYDVYPLLDE